MIGLPAAAAAAGLFALTSGGALVASVAQGGPGFGWWLDGRWIPLLLPSLCLGLAAVALVARGKRSNRLETAVSRTLLQPGRDPQAMTQLRIAGLVVSDSPYGNDVRRRIWLGRGDDGTASLALLDGAGHKRIVMRVAENGESSISVLDATGKRLTSNSSRRRLAARLLQKAAGQVFSLHRARSGAAYPHKIWRRLSVHDLASAISYLNAGVMDGGRRCMVACS